MEGNLGVLSHFITYILEKGQFYPGIFWKSILSSPFKGTFWKKVQCFFKVAYLEIMSNIDWETGLKIKSEVKNL